MQSAMPQAEQAREELARLEQQRLLRAERAAREAAEAELRLEAQRKVTPLYLFRAMRAIVHDMLRRMPSGTG